MTSLTVSVSSMAEQSVNSRSNISLLLKSISLSAPARIRKGQGAEILNRALCVASRKLGYTGDGSGRG